jgi:hypothetical protein
MAPLKAWESVPELSAEIVLMTSAMLLRPLFSMSSALMSVTGYGDSVLVRRMYEPVTTMASSVDEDGAPPAGGPCGSAPAKAAADSDNRQPTTQQPKSLLIRISQ